MVANNLKRNTGKKNWVFLCHSFLKIVNKTVLKQILILRKLCSDQTKHCSLQEIHCNSLKIISPPLVYQLSTTLIITMLNVAVCFRVSFVAFCYSVMVNGAISIYLSFYTIKVLEESWNPIYIIYMFIMFFFEFISIYLVGQMVSTVKI